jgi:hypothetical protein
MKLRDILLVQILLMGVYGVICMGAISTAVHGDELAAAPVLPPDPRQCAQLAYVIDGTALPPLPDAAQRATLARYGRQSSDAPPCFCILLPQEDYLAEAYPAAARTVGATLLPASAAAAAGDDATWDDTMRDDAIRKGAHCRWIP